MSTRANRVRNIGITGRGKGRLQPRTAVEDERMVLRTTLRYLRQHKVRAVGLGAAGAGLGVTLYSISRYPAVRSGASESPPGLASLVQDGWSGAVGTSAKAAGAVSTFLSGLQPVANAPGDLATAVASSVTKLKSDCAKREAMYLLRHTPLLHWVVASALREDRRRNAAEGRAHRVLVDLLSDGATASHVLQCPGTVPTLLGHFATAGWEGRLAEAVIWAVTCGPPVKHSSPSDVEAVIRLLEPRIGWRTRRMAAAMVSAWAASSPANCLRLAEANIGPVLGATAALSAGGADSQRELHWEVVRAMGVLASRTPPEGKFGFETWVDPLLYIAADAAAACDTDLACGALEVLTACLEPEPSDSSPVYGAVAGSNLLTLLERLSREDDSRTRLAVVSSLAACAVRPGCRELSSAEREVWTHRVLGWMMEQPEQGGDGISWELTEACALALAAMAETDGQEGVWVAQQWLSALLLHLADHSAAKAAAAKASPRRPRLPNPFASAAALRGRWRGRRANEQSKEQQGTTDLASLAAGPQSAEGPAAVERVGGSGDSTDVVGKVAVKPQRAREVAKELQTTSRAAVIVHEPPPEHELHLSREAMLVYPELAAKVDAALAEKVTSKALTELSLLTSGNRDRMQWLLHAGLLHVLHRLVLHTDLWRSSNPGGALQPQDGGPTEAPLPIQRTAARIISILATERSFQHWIRDSDWGPWLQAGSITSDCILSSCCTRALLTLEATEADSVATKQSPGSMSDALVLLLAGEAPRAGEPLVLHDGMHLLDPLAEHHRILAMEGTGSRSPGAPLMDILFIHGVRGNAFGTWRILSPGFARDAMTPRDLWPSSWLTEAITDTRMLSYEYAAPASNREGESLPLEDLVEATTAKWLAAGIGERPTVVVCHSLGGVLLKEVIRRCQRPGASARERQLLEELRGVIFYATPHFGTYLADIGWGLRTVGASPANVVRHLKPGPHHEPCNEALRLLYSRGRLSVLSFGEMLRTPLMSIAPWLHKDAALKMEVVPMESAYPGVGDFVALHGVDHINACKPSSPTDASYVRALEFIQQRLEDARAEASDREQPMWDRVPGAN